MGFRLLTDGTWLLGSSVWLFDDLANPNMFLKKKVQNKGSLP
jgi:hypothetical protein